MKPCLNLPRPTYYRVKRGQTLLQIASAFGIPPRLLAKVNALTEEPRAGQVLKIPAKNCNLYRVRGAESKTQLCGSPEAFERKNGTHCLYPEQLIFL
ncbi:MAG: LysM peptidoglycan-binding domain-containing protein [Clostridia bacterium]|nr:LysM peptidoglycan-binding domain-containing protein [Clostridia bacterium]